MQRENLIIIVISHSNDSVLFFRLQSKGIKIDQDFSDAFVTTQMLLWRRNYVYNVANAFVPKKIE